MVHIQVQIIPQPVHFPLIVQQPGEYLLVCHYGPLREECLPISLLRLHLLDESAQLCHAREYCVDLEGEAPAEGIFIVFLQQIEFGGDILPLGDRLLHDIDVGEMPLQNGKESGLAAADVAFDRVNHTHFQLFIKQRKNVKN